MDPPLETLLRGTHGRAWWKRSGRPGSAPDEGAITRYLGWGAPNGSAVARKWGAHPMGPRRGDEPRDAKGALKSKNTYLSRLYTSPSPRDS